LHFFTVYICCGKATISVLVEQAQTNLYGLNTAL